MSALSPAEARILIALHEGTVLDEGRPAWFTLWSGGFIFGRGGAWEITEKGADSIDDAREVLLNEMKSRLKG